MQGVKERSKDGANFNKIDVIPFEERENRRKSKEWKARTYLFHC